MGQFFCRIARSYVHGEGRRSASLPLVVQAKEFLICVAYLQLPSVPPPACVRVVPFPAMGKKKP